MEKHDKSGSIDLTRRGFVGATSAAGVSAVFTAEVSAQTESASNSSAAERKITLRVNGQDHEITIDPRVTVLDALRERLQLTGTKKGCDHGQCGACTVLINGRRVNSCLSLAVMYEGDEITTVEGLARGDELHPVQAAFVEHDGFQCGYCTPGQLCSAAAMIEELKAHTLSYVTPDVRKTDGIEITEDEIRERMSGNICRCGAYPNIVAAVRAVYGSTRS